MLWSDEYDLNSSEKVATKSTIDAGSAFGCYCGVEGSMLAHGAQVDP